MRWPRCNRRTQGEAPPVRPERVGKIAGVVHVDQTARVQTVDHAAAPAFAALIEHFHAITGVLVVLNTSFNDREPIVETPPTPSPRFSHATWTPRTSGTTSSNAPELPH
ncbi:carbamoyltransferase C-terminal domain-containing protein [Streptomyces sp. NPDC058268]|uniref:carbamoyltransferase C-terminal domain-containing protein n=1 Tax=Streptomyces sp. NPDC058268 TaxID=3346413 RepID=UPI0036E270EC